MIKFTGKGESLLDNFSRVVVVEFLNHDKLFLCNCNGLHHGRLPCPWRGCSKSYPLSRWVHLTISSPFLSHLQSFSASECLPVSWLFASSGQSLGASVSASTHPVNIQDWFPLALTSLISCSPQDLQESSPTPQLKSINSLMLSLLYGPILTFIHDYWKNSIIDYMDLCQQSDVSAL